MPTEVEDWEWQLDRAITDAWFDLAAEGRAFHLSQLVSAAIDRYRDIRADYGRYLAQRAERLHEGERAHAD